MSVCKSFFALVLVLDWTQCLLQGAGALPAMLRGRMTGFPKILGPGPPERQDKVDTICTVPLDCGTPTTRRLYPFGARHRGPQTDVLHCSTHCFSVSLICRRSSKEQECARSGHSNICLVFSDETPQSHVVSPS